MRTRSETRNRMLTRGESGMTLIETLIALSILFITAAGLAGLGAIAMVTTENQGHLAARVVEYAQDKMEQLTSLKYSDVCTTSTCSTANASDTVTVSSTVNCVQYFFADDTPCNSGGSGLTVGGVDDADCGVGTHPACVNLYIDYLDQNGNPLGGGTTAPSGWFYKRVWKIETPANTNGLKKITVSCTTRSIVGGTSTNKAPHATLVMYKSNPF